MPPCPTKRWPKGHIRIARNPGLTCDYLCRDGVCGQPIDPGDSYFDDGIRDDATDHPKFGGTFRRYCLGAGHEGVPSVEAAAHCVANAPPRRAWNRKKVNGDD